MKDNHTVLGGNFMKSSIKFLGVIALVAVIGFLMPACGNEPPGPPPPPPPQPGDSVNNPIERSSDTNLGTMTSPTSGWRQLLNSIESAKKYVDLDLSACTMTGTSFNPDATVETGKKYIVSIILPTVATSIEAGTNSNPSFKNFTNLKSISGENIITIGDYSFLSSYGGTYPRNLQSVNFPRATTIGESAFSGTCLESMNFPLVTTIGKSAFYGTYLKSVNFPLVTIISESAFSACGQLKNTSFPLVTNIGAEAFSGCRDLQDVNFPQVTVIGTYVFSNCNGLKSASFPLLSTIGTHAFFGCSNLVTLNIPKVTDIGRSALSYTGDATLSITMGSTAPTLGREMFFNGYGDSNIVRTVRLKIPSGATGYSPASSPFSGTSVTVNSGTTANWANGFRGGGWNGYTWNTGSTIITDGSTYINQNISLIIEQQ
jgi:hypothetical protein